MFQICKQAQKYYKEHGFATKILEASLTSVDEIFALAGVDHITIAPKLLHQLASIETDPSDFANLMSVPHDVKVARDRPPSRIHYADDEAAFRMAMTREANGASEGKLIQVCEDKGSNKL